MRKRHVIMIVSSIRLSKISNERNAFFDAIILRNFGARRWDRTIDLALIRRLL